MGDKTNHYKTLGLPPDAGETEIRAAYRALAKKYHPDAGESSSVEKFRAVQDAYDLLSDTEKRREYDQAHIAESRIPIRYTVHSSPRFSHIDLREIMNPRAQACAERSRGRSVDPFQELFEFLFWDF